MGRAGPQDTPRRPGKTCRVRRKSLDLQDISLTSVLADPRQHFLAAAGSASGLGELMRKLGGRVERNREAAGGVTCAAGTRKRNPILWMGTPSPAKQQPWRHQAAWDWMWVASAVPETALSGQSESRGQKGASLRVEGTERHRWAAQSWAAVGRRRGGAEPQELIFGSQSYVPETDSCLEG